MKNMKMLRRKEIKELKNSNFWERRRRVQVLVLNDFILKKEMIILGGICGVLFMGIGFIIMAVCFTSGYDNFLAKLILSLVVTLVINGIIYYCMSGFYINPKIQEAFERIR